MSIAEKLLKIAQNEPKVYEAGKISQIQGIAPAAVDASLFGGKLKTIAENTIKVFEAGRQSANMLKATASGKVVRVDNVNPIEHELGVTVLSKNLCPTETLQVQSANAWASKPLGEFDLPNGTYTFSCDYERLDEQNVPVAVSVKRKDGSQITEFYGVNGKISKSFTVDDGGCKLYLYSNMSANVIETNALFKNIQLELGSTATTYTPYMTEFEGVTVTRYGKNLLPFPYYTTTRIISGVTYTVGEYGSLTVEGTATANANFNFIIAKYDTALSMKAGIYTLSLGAPIDDNIQFRLGTIAEDGTLVLKADIKRSGEKEKTFTLEEDARIYINCVVGKNHTVPKMTFYPMLELGSTATEYEPYKEPQTATANAEDGTVEGLRSLSPTTTLISDSDSVIITAEYYK